MKCSRVPHIAALVLLGGAGCVMDPGFSDERSTAKLDVDVTVDIQTAHPYRNRQTQQWEIAAPDEATAIAVTFDRFETERGYDFVDLYDATGQRVHHLSGRHTGESFAVDGNRLVIRFRSDSSITGWGFAITHHSYSVADPEPPADHRPTCSSVGGPSEGWYWADTGELIRIESCAGLAEPECGAIGSRSEGWYVADHGRIVFDNCHRLARIALYGETCGGSIGFSCWDGLYCQGVPQGVVGGTGTCLDDGACVTADDCNADGNEWIRPMCMGNVTCETGRCGVHCGGQLEGPWSWTTYLVQGFESAHPYSNDFDQTWDVHHDGATKMRVFFDRIDTERGYDRLTLSGDVEENLTMLEGTYDDLWTDEIAGDTVHVNLHTDRSVTRWGFALTQVSAYEQLPLGICNRDEDCAESEHCVPHMCFSAYGPCRGDCAPDEPGPPPGDTWETFAAAGLPLAIPDAPTDGITAPLTVAGMAAVGCGVAASVTIRHSYVGDLRVVLARPDGSEVVLHDRAGGSADDIVLQEESTGLVNDPNGIWTLRVSDHAAWDTGTLESFSLVVDCS